MGLTDTMVKLISFDISVSIRRRPRTLLAGGNAAVEGEMLRLFLPQIPANPLLLQRI